MRGEYDRILRVLKGTDIPLFALSLFFYIIALSLASVRLKLIIESQGNIPVKMLECLELTYIGYFFNNFLPTAIGGDVVKAFHLSKKTHEKMECYTAIFVDRAVGLITMILMGFTSVLFVNSEIVDPNVKNIIFVITAASLIGVLFIVNKGIARRFSFLLRLARPIEERLIQAYNTLHKYKKYKLIMLQSLAISVASQIFFFATMGTLALSIGTKISPLDLLLRMPIVSAMSLLPSINGLGVREGSIVLFFGPLIGKENAFAISIELLALLLVTSLVGGLIYAFSPQFKVKLADIT